MEEANYTQMLAQQAAVAAQAAMQLTVQPQAQAAAAQWVNTLVVSVSSIPEFDGEPNNFTDFLERGTVMSRQVAGSALEENLRVAIHQMITGKISVSIRRELGLNVNSSWDECVKKLKEGYGGARKSYQRQVVSLLNLGRGKGESPGAYAQMMEAQTRAICARVVESENDKTGAQYVIQLIKSLVLEKIKREVPDRVKKSLKTTSTPLRLDEAVDIVREEDEEFRESRRTDEDWTKVTYSRQKRETPRREYRERGEYKPQVAKPRWQLREEYRPREEYLPRGGRDQSRRDRPDERRCYQCKQKGHIARFCPYMRQSTGYRDRGEPMEVNFGEFVREAQTRRGRYVWVDDNRMDTGGSDEEKVGTSSGEESGGSMVVPKKKSTPYAEVTGQSTGSRT
ncbi:hypothetical protein AAG570_010832 [Ranatra chinensis]|uniref:CCHC-type domain-containing protein n=1 Tax=Ranatra chinensis TaxID=642074 RepID=A0ABD0YJ69_9HEMI